MKSVLISIRPWWCLLIAQRKKTIEVRKTIPKLKPPFKVYIYCTKDKRGWFDFGKKERLDGKTIGEFVCDCIIPISVKYSNPNHHIANREFPFTGLTDKQIMDYLGNGKEGYGWHISNLVIYDKPKNLSNFHRPCDSRCVGICEFGCVRTLTKAPQSWCYVEEIAHESR